MENVIETYSLTKVFSDWWGRGKVRAVDGLNLAVGENEVFGLLGPNGSGKTTTLKMLLGLLHPTKGHALLLGGDSTDPKISSRIGFLPEESYLYRYLNARETLDFYGRLFSLPSRVRKQRIETLLEMVGLKAVANRPVGTFSKGMARRIGLAQALINDPELLILDEPTTGLDPIGTRQIKDLIIRLAQRGKTILLSSHLLADVEDVCDRIAILYGGKIQSEGQVKQLLEKSDKQQITTTRLSQETLEKIRQILQDENGEYEIASPMEKLETFFINTVTAAQKEQRQTSGAVSTTQIGDFLNKGGDKENLLQKLVNSSEDQTGSKEDKQSRTQKVAKKEELARPKADSEMLNKLTTGSQQTEPETIEQDTEPTEDTPSEKTEPDNNVLEQLTGKENPEPKTDKPTDEKDQKEE